MSDEQEFERILYSMHSGDLPPVEVVYGDFRAIARNFFTLPIQLLMDLKQAQLDQDGSDLLLLFDAVEMCFSEADYERLKDMNIRDFLNVVHAWVNFDRGLDGLE